MRSTNKFLTLVAVTFFFAFGATSIAMVYDGGKFVQDRVTTHTDLGSDGPEPAPTNLAYDLDRYSNAPVGVPLYVLGSDDKCYRGNFSYSKYEKVLIFYSKSQVAAPYCIYQKGFSSAPSGFAISTKEGGTCVPAIAGNNGDGVGVEERGSAVAFSDCIGETVSYGEYMEKNKDKEVVRSIASTNEEQPAQAANKETLPGWVTSAQEVTQNPTAKSDNDSTQPIKLEMPVGQAPTTHEAAAPMPKVAEATPVLKNGFTFQISSHSNSDEAEAKVKALQEKGVETFVMKGSVNGATWYRVCSGRYETMKAAKAAQKSFSSKTGIQGTFIQKITSPESASVN